jgi:NAD(P)-dependent dehydrogenase (short-subunit alcohol dehydrogenase family)
VAATLAAFGRLDILVNNAATSPYAGPLIDIDLPRFDETVEVNLRAPLVWTQQAWRQWQSEHGGSVLNIASIGAMKFGGPIGAYDMTKAGLVHLTKHLATELGPRVRVNALAPGLVQTNFARYLWEGRGADPAEAAWPWPMARLGQPAEGRRLPCGCPASTRAGSPARSSSSTAAPCSVPGSPRRAEPTSRASAGGGLRIGSPAGGGTRLRAVLPGA